MKKAKFPPDPSVGSMRTRETTCMWGEPGGLRERKDSVRRPPRKNENPVAAIVSAKAESSPYRTVTKILRTLPHRLVDAQSLVCIEMHLSFQLKCSDTQTWNLGRIDTVKLEAGALLASGVGAVPSDDQKWAQRVFSSRTCLRSSVARLSAESKHAAFRTTSDFSPMLKPRG